MRVIGHLLVARRFPVALGLTIAVFTAICIWTDAVLVLDNFPPQRPVGIGPDQMGAMLLAALLPAIGANALSTYERLAAPHPRRVLTAYTLLLGLLPGVTVLIWATAVHITRPIDALDIPPLTPRVASFALLGLIGLIATLIAGVIWGPVLSLAAFIALPIAQNAYGADLAWNMLSTGTSWHTNWWINTAALAAATWLTYRRGGVPLARNSSDDTT